MRRTIRGTSPVVEQAARSLRSSPTAAEEALWSALQKKRVAGMRFRRQHPLGRFIVDFCCPSERLVVEVDGSVHGARQEQDEARTAVLEAYGYRVLRFTNEDVTNRLPHVVRTIAVFASESP